MTPPPTTVAMVAGPTADAPVVPPPARWRLVWVVGPGSCSMAGGWPGLVSPSPAAASCPAWRTVKARKIWENPRRDRSTQIVQSLMLDCLPRTSNSPTWARSLGGRRRAWRVESAMRTDCLVIFVIPSMRDAVFTVSP